MGMEEVIGGAVAEQVDGAVGGVTNAVAGVDFVGGLDSFSAMLRGFAGGNPGIMIAIAIGLIAFAFFSYKIYNAAIIIIGAAAGGVPSYIFLSPLMADAFDMHEAWFPIVVGLVGALLGIAIIKALQKLAVFIAGGALGYFLGSMINTVVIASGQNEFLMQMPGSLIIPIVTAAILGLLSGKMFKLVFVIGTALVSCISAANLFFSAISGGATPIALMIGVGIGAVASIFQLKGKSKK